MQSIFLSSTLYIYIYMYHYVTLQFQLLIWSSLIITFRSIQGDKVRATKYNFYLHLFFFIPCIYLVHLIVYQYPFASILFILFSIAIYFETFKFPYMRGISNVSLHPTLGRLMYFSLSYSSTLTNPTRVTPKPQPTQLSKSIAYANFLTTIRSRRLRNFMKFNGELSHRAF